MDITMKPFHVMAKQLFGVRYENIRKSLFSCLIIFSAVYAAQIRVAVAPFILYLTATSFSLGVMWRSLDSAQNAETMMGVFMLPFDNKELIGSYLLAFGSYTLVTKTLLVLTLFFTVGTWNVTQILTAVLCACNGCALAAAGYIMLRKRNVISVILWGCGIILSIFFVKQLALFCGIIGISFVMAVLYLLSGDAYMFYRPVSVGKRFSQTKGKESVLRYLLRYLTTNKSYLMNTAGIWMIACFLPLLIGQFDGLNTKPLGFAILTLNTPLCILLSCDRELEQAVRALPGQIMRFGSWYCVFIFVVNMIADSIYLIGWQFQNGGVLCTDVLMAVFFALQSAILSVILEWRYPIRDWKIENDLWHHPRKYIVPLLMLMEAVFIGTR